MIAIKTTKTTRTFHLKELLSLGLKKGQITNIVQKAEVFRGVLKQQGYAIDYTFNQAVFLHIGGELSRLGMSFRHINKILFDLSNVDFEKDREKIMRGRLALFIFSKVLSREEHERLKAIRQAIGRKGRGSGKTALGENPVRMASISFCLLRERDIQGMNGVLGDYIRISLHKMVSNVAGLYASRLLSV